MTNPNYDYLAIVADRSGSMKAIREEAEGALKGVVTEQRKLPGELTVNLFTFDDKFEEVPEGDIDTWTLQPRGMTALYDAIGKSMTIVGERLAAMPEDQRPGKVMFVIVTDGMENCSREWRLDTVRNLVTEQQDRYGWQVIFTAANLDAHAVGTSLGLRKDQNMNFAYSGVGAASAGNQILQSVSNYRSGATRSMNVPQDAS